MPPYLDIGLIVVVLISALLSMVRGFTREVLAILSWGAAAVAAYSFYPAVLPYAKQYIPKETIAIGVSVAAVFFMTLIVVSLITVKLSDTILDSRVGALDRSLGFLFGAARGLLLCVVAFQFYAWLAADKQQPDWVRSARSKPLLQATGQQLMAMLPDNPDSLLFSKLKRPNPGGGADEPPPEPPDAAQPIVPAAPPVNRTPSQPSSALALPPAAPVGPPAPASPPIALTEKQKLDALLEKAGVGKPTSLAPRRSTP